MFDFTKKVIISSLVLAGTLSADYKEVSKVEIAQMEQLELFKRAQIKINKAYDTGSIYILNISVQGNPDEIYLTKDKKRLKKLFFHLHFYIFREQLFLRIVR